MTHHPDEKEGTRQKDMVLAYIREHGSITKLDALVDLGCMRLASRISELNIKDGACIKKRMIEVPKRRTAGTDRVAEYYIEQPKRSPLEQIGLLAS